MNNLQVKYAVGQTVYLATTVSTIKQRPCPDCLGKKKWRAISPAGTEYEFACPRCANGYKSNPKLSLDYVFVKPKVKRLTIGSIRVDTLNKDQPVSYMALETGVGSGTLWAEADLFESRSEAGVVAREKAESANRANKRDANQYNGNLRLFDDELWRADK